MAQLKTNSTACFFGHREINETEELKEKLKKTVLHLISKEGIERFLFGSKSAFDDLCLEIVTQIKKEMHLQVERVCVRAMYPDLDESYKEYLLTLYDDTYFPEQIQGAGRAIYVERNYEMIDQSRICVVYYDEENAPKKRKSGTKVALDYAHKKKKEIIMLP